MASSVDITAFINSLEQQYLPRARKAALKAVKAFAEEVKKEAQNLCPVDTGFLQRSAYVNEPHEEPGGDISIEIGFNAEYAVFVHEMPGKRHPHGQWKFLETPLRAMAPELGNFVVEELHKEFGP